MHKIAIVVQRYGEEINGGSELAARLLAEKLQQFYDITVITTCAQDYYSWKDHYGPGESYINGIRVMRFKVDHERNKKTFDTITSKIISELSTPLLEEQWIRHEGPISSPLLEYIYHSKEEYFRFIFVTYLYATTYYGLPLVHTKAILIPTAHDEPTLHFSIYDRLFSLVKHLIFLTEEEGQVIKKRFPQLQATTRVIGIGLDTPFEISPSPISTKHTQNRYNLHHPYFVYVGRVDPSKGCEELFTFFLKYKEQIKSNIKLIVIGKSEMTIPTSSDIIDLGYISNQDKWDIMSGALALINPSLYESFSFVVLEAMYCNIPSIVNSKSTVLADHIVKSKNGVLYNTYNEFVTALSTVQKIKVDRGYLKQYEWTSIILKYREEIERV